MGKTSLGQCEGYGDEAAYIRVLGSILLRVQVPQKEYLGFGY